MDFVRAFDLVATFLEGRGFPVALIGGLGLHAYGITRGTFDMDLITEGAARDGLIEFLEGEGFETLHRSDGFSNHVRNQAGGERLDFVYVDSETSRKLFPACGARLELGARKALVPRAEHLIAMKVQAMKNDPSRAFQDMADIQELLRIPATDRQEVRGYFQRAGMTEEFDAICRRL